MGEVDAGFSPSAPDDGPVVPTPLEWLGGPEPRGSAPAIAANGAIATTYSAEKAAACNQMNMSCGEIFLSKCYQLIRRIGNKQPGNCATKMIKDLILIMPTEILEADKQLLDELAQIFACEEGQVSNVTAKKVVRLILGLAKRLREFHNIQAQQSTCAELPL